MGDRMDPKVAAEQEIAERKRRIVLCILKFLKEEVQRSSSERQESLEVAIQCLEVAYTIDYNVDRSSLGEEDNLMALFNINPRQAEDVGEHEAEAETHKNRGNTLMHEAQVEEALEAYNKAIALNPKNAVYYCNRAAAFCRLGRYEQAVLDSKEAIRLDPKYGKAYGRLGMSLTNLGSYDKAKIAYEKALELDPGNVTYKTNMDMLDIQKGSGQGEAAAASAAPPNPLAGGSFQLPPEATGNFSSLMNNPQMFSMISQMLNDPNIHNAVTGIMAGEQMDFNALIRMGCQLAEQVQTQDPSMVNNFRRQMFGEGQGGPDDSKPKDDSNQGAGGDSK